MSLPEALQLTFLIYAYMYAFRCMEMQHLCITQINEKRKYKTLRKFRVYKSPN